MLVTVTNVGTDIIYIAAVNKTLAPGEVLVFSRTASDLDREVALKDMVAAGDPITLSYAAEDHDSVVASFGVVPPTYAAGDLPDPAAVPPGTMVWNSTQGMPNYSDGTSWIVDAGGDVSVHAALTTGVHGVGASTVASAAAIGSAVTAHDATTGVHGVGASTVASAASVGSAVTAHDATTGVHGVGASAVASVAAVGSAVTAHDATTGVHGVGASTVASVAAIGSAVTAHDATTGVHGVGASTVASLLDCAPGTAINALVALKKKIVNVDGGRIDAYTADGSVERPYKTIATALAVAVAGDTIHVLPTLASYVENVTLPAGVSMEGGGCVGAYTVIQGDFVTSVGGAVTLKNIHFGLNAGVGSLTINSSGCDLRECFCDGPIVCNSAQPVTFFNLTAANTVAATTALTASGAGAVQCLFCRFSTTGDAPTIAHSAGWLMLSNCQVSGSRAAGPVLDSTGGYVTFVASQVLNAGGGVAADLTNAAAGTPNVISALIAAGNVDVTGAATLIDNLVFQGAGALVGENAATTFHSPGMFIAAGAVGVVWAAAKPVTRTDAVDRIAAALSTLLGAPIA